MATGLEIIVGTYEEFLLGYRVRPSKVVSGNAIYFFPHVLIFCLHFLEHQKV